MADAGLPVGSLRKSTLDELWNAPALRRIRLDMLAGRENPECRRCHETERAGFPSDRETANRTFARHLPRAELTRPDGSLGELHMPYMDMRFSNFCNFRCRTCAPGLSHSWHDDWKRLHWRGFLTPQRIAIDGGDEFWRRIEELAPHLEEVYFAGGEPLLMPEQTRVLEMLASKRLFGVRLRYSTNFSALPARMLELWDRFESVTIMASLDGSRRRGDYLRKGQNWEQVLRNRELLARRCPRAKLALNSTLSVFNALHLPDLQREWLQNGWIEPEGALFHLLLIPREYRIQMLPPALKSAAREAYRRHIDAVLEALGERAQKPRALYEGALRFLDAQDLADELPRFRRLTRRLDRIRGEDFTAAFPELSSLMA